MKDVGNIPSRGMTANTLPHEIDPPGGLPRRKRFCYSGSRSDAAGLPRMSLHPVPPTSRHSRRSKISLLDSPSSWSLEGLSSCLCEDCGSRKARITPRRKDSAAALPIGMGDNNTLPFTHTGTTHTPGGDRADAGVLAFVIKSKTVTPFGVTVLLWCGRRDLNPHVYGGTQAPQACLSTYSSTPAYSRCFGPI